MKKKSKALSPLIQKLEVGEQVQYPIEKLFSVRTIACTKGLELSRKYKTSVDRKKRVIIVTRLS